MPLVSIVVPVYKVENVLHYCIDSILNQTYKDFELILVDAVVLVHAEFESQTEALKELLVVLSVVLQHGFKLRRNLLLNARRDKL